LCETEGLVEEQTEIIKAVRAFDHEKILPGTELQHADEDPQEIVDGLKEPGIFGLMIPGSTTGSASRC
jgi:hypothetical protein